MNNTQNEDKMENQSTEKLFFSNSDLNDSKIDKIVSDSLLNADDGELYLEFCESESFIYDDQRLKSASFDVSKTVDLRFDNAPLPTSILQDNPIEKVV